MAEKVGSSSSLPFRIGSLFTKSRDWIVSRSGLEEFIEETERRKVPKHALNPIYCLGGVTLVALMILGLTGLFLDSYYEPSAVELISGMSRAQQSIQRISNDVPFGFYVKSVHSWAANVMVITTLLLFMTARLLLLLTRLSGQHAYANWAHKSCKYWKTKRHKSFSIFVSLADMDLLSAITNLLLSSAN